MVRTLCWSMVLFGPLVSLVATAEDVDRLRSPPPSLLEFLAEFGQVDDTTFELIVYHALGDDQKTQKAQVQLHPQTHHNKSSEGENAPR